MRSAARASRDWSTADRLKAEIEEAGWQVIDSGAGYRLEAAHAPDVVVDGAVLYGRSEAVPDRFEEPDLGPATVVLVATEHAADVLRAVDALGRTAPTGTSVVVVADGLAAARRAELEHELATRTMAGGVELIATSARLGAGAALNIGIRRAIGAAVVVLDPSVEPQGDVLTPLIRALDHPDVAVAGPFGLATEDLRRFDELPPTALRWDAAAIEGSVMAFRRSDAATRGPFDERFRVPSHLDIWWSLVLRDEGEERPPRRAVVVPDLPLDRHERRGSVSAPRNERDRLSKRNFYRVLDRFGNRQDLIVPLTTEGKRGRP